MGAQSSSTRGSIEVRDEKQCDGLLPWDPKARTCGSPAWFEFMYSLKKFGYVWDLTNVLLSLTTITIYVTNTYHSGSPSSSLFWVDQGCNVFFVADLFLHAYIAPDRLNFWLHWSTWLDVVSLLAIADGPTFASWARVFRVVRILRILRLGRRLDRKLYEAIEILLGTFALIFLIAGLVQSLSHAGEYFVNNDGETGLEFHEAFYFVVVTITTVGYGDVLPTSALSQLIVVMMLPLTVTAFSIAASKVSKRWKKDPYSTTFTRRHGSVHVLVCGKVDPKLSHTLFSTLLVSQKSPALTLVLLDPENQSRLLDTPLLRENMITFVGDPASARDLDRVQAKHAKYILLLTDNTSDDPDAADRKVMLQALQIKRLHPASNIVVTLNREQNRPDLSEHIINSVCYDHVRGYCTALSVMHPGCQTLLFNLLWRAQIPTGCFPHRTQNEYLAGLNYEIYRTRIPPIFHGLELSQFHRYLRSRDLLFVGFCEREVDNSEKLGSVNLDREDFVWLLARDLEEIQEMSLNENGSQWVGASQLQVAHSDVKELVVASVEVGAISPTTQQVEKASTESCDIIICCFRLEDWLFAMFRALSRWPKLTEFTVKVLLDQEPDKDLELRLQEEAPFIQVEVRSRLNTTQALREAGVAKGRRVLLTRPSDRGFDSILLAANRIVTLVLEEGQQGRSFVFEVERTSSAIGSCLGHKYSSPICDHSTDQVSLASMSGYDDAGNLEFREKFESIMNDEEDKGIAPDIESILSLLSYEHASGSWISQGVMDLFLAHSVLQPSLTWKISNLLGMAQESHILAFLWSSFEGQKRATPQGEASTPQMQRVEIPTRFAGQAYGDLVQHCFDQNVVCLGIFRAAFAHRCTSDRGYVCTNPPDGTLLNLGDDLFVIAEKGWKLG